MPETSLARLSPLAGATLPITPLDAPGMLMAEVPFLTTLSLRGDAGDGAVCEAIGAAVGLVPPTKVGEMSVKSDLLLGCLSPDEWLLLDLPGQEDTYLTALEGALAGRRATAVVLSDNGTHIRITGPHARDVLAKSGVLDLHDRVFPTGRIARSLLARVEATLIREQDETYLIGVRRSFAAHLWAQLADDALEFGVARLEPTASGAL